MRQLLLAVLLFGCASTPVPQKTAVPPADGCPEGVVCPEMRCGVSGGTATSPQVFLNCYVVNAHSIPEWRLYGKHADELMFFSEGHAARVEAPEGWRLFEMRAKSSDDEVRAARLLIRAVGGKLEHRAP